jgi:hypothetical protein
VVGLFFGAEASWRRESQRGDEREYATSVLLLEAGRPDQYVNLTLI